LENPAFNNIPPKLLVVSFCGQYFRRAATTSAWQTKDEALAKLRGKTAVITGGSTGMALATAKLFAAEGAKVFVTGRRQDILDAAVAEIGSGAVGVQGDVADLADLDRLYETVRAEAGHIDILFSSPGDRPHESADHHGQRGGVRHYV